MMAKYVVEINDYCTIRLANHDENGVTFKDAKEETIEYIADMIIAYTQKIRMLQTMTEKTFPSISFKV